MYYDFASLNVSDTLKDQKSILSIVCMRELSYLPHPFYLVTVPPSLTCLINEIKYIPPQINIIKLKQIQIK